MTKTVEALRERVYDIVSNLDDCDLFSLYNDYCDREGYYDDRIYDMEEFEELMDGCVFCRR